MINLIAYLDQVGLLFLSDLSRQKCTKYTSQQGFDVPDSPTGHGEEKMGFRRQQTQMETGHQMCRTRDRTAFRVRGRNHKLFAPHECADRSNLVDFRVHKEQVSYFPEDAKATTPACL